MEVTRAQLELHRMNTGFRKVPVRCANQVMRQLLYRFDGKMVANVIIGGVDADFKTHLFCTRSDGTTDTVPFTSLGTGCMAAMSVLEARWEEDLDEESARDLVRDAVTVGVDNDLQSGNNVCLCIIRSDFSVYWEERVLKKKTPVQAFPLIIKPGSTTILSTIEHMVAPWGEALEWDEGPDSRQDGDSSRPEPGNSRGDTGERANRRHEYLGPPKAKRRRLE
ncbi:proteasome subunit beta type-7 isoform X2 [Drosophila elegans]|nr:proteasome subunit beta type-7 isoform X2 [Drosophila elegans]